jgi:hypothetical protein
MATDSKASSSKTAGQEESQLEPTARPLQPTGKSDFSSSEVNFFASILYLYPSSFSRGLVGRVHSYRCGGPGSIPGTKTKKLHDLSRRANYTDRETAACQRSDFQLLRIKGATWSA